MTPRPMPDRRVPVLAAGLVVLLALPVFLIAGWDVRGWALGAVMWVGFQGLGILLNRAGIGKPTMSGSGVYAFGSLSRGIVLMLVLIVVAQVKINVTNAYSGSLAWSNVFTRMAKHYPGRTIFVLFNLVIAYVLMMLDVFTLISFVLSLYANVVMAWLVTIANLAWDRAKVLTPG